MATPNSTTPERQCSKCGQRFPLTPEHWYKSKQNAYGLSTICKLCVISKSRQWAIDNRERYLEKQRRWNVEHAEEISQRNRIRRQANLEEYRARDREYAAAHREEANARAKKHYADNREAKKVYAREYYRTHKSKAIAQRTASLRRWRHANPERARAQVIRRRALKRNADGSFTEADIRLAYKSQKGRCWWCEKALKGKYHIDHRIPLSRGGSNDPSNLCLTCAACNMSKGAKLPHEWSDRLL